MSPADPVSPGAVHAPKVHDAECMFVDYGNIYGNSFFYFFHQVGQLGFAQGLKKGSVLRFHDFYINVFIKILKGFTGICFPGFIPFDNTKMGYYLVPCNT